MTITLDLPPSVEDALTREAERRGTTPEDLALDSLQRLFLATASFESLPEMELKTGADVIAQWQAEGAFWARDGQPDSPELSRQIRNTAWR